MAELDPEQKRRAAARGETLEALRNHRAQASAGTTIQQLHAGDPDEEIVDLDEQHASDDSDES